MGKDLLLEPLPWHQSLWEPLLRSERLGRLPHALLLKGPPGLGKHRFARRLAGTLLCTGRGAAVAPCGQCRGCRLFAAGNHPAFTLIAPAEEGKAIRIDAIREYTARESLTAQDGGYKIAVIEPADAMNTAAANSLLKTLEEPAPRTLIVLVTSHFRRLPATIKSRCQHLDFRPPERAAALAWLTPQLKGPDAALLLDLAAGAPLGALALSEPGILEERLERLAEFSSLASGAIEPTALAAAWKEVDLTRLLAWMWSWVADMVRLKIAGGEPRLANPDQKELLQNIANGIESKELYRFLDKINETTRGLGGQLNTQMSVESLLLAWLNGLGAARSFAQHS